MANEKLLKRKNDSKNKKTILKGTLIIIIMVIIILNQMQKQVDYLQKLYGIRIWELVWEVTSKLCFKVLLIFNFLKFFRGSIPTRETVHEKLLLALTCSFEHRCYKEKSIPTKKSDLTLAKRIFTNWYSNMMTKRRFCQNFNCYFSTSFFLS